MTVATLEVSAEERMDAKTSRPSTAALSIVATGESLVRYGLVTVLFWIGAMKFTAYEAAGISGLVSNSPLLSWGSALLGERAFSALLGSTEIAVALLIACRPWSARAGALGSALAVGIFLTTLSFLLTTPGVWEVSAGGFPALSVLPGQFLVKDVVLLGAAVWSLGEAHQALPIPGDGGHGKPARPRPLDQPKVRPLQPTGVCSEENEDGGNAMSEANRAATRGVHHVGLTVPDLATAKAFFVGTLGYEQVGEVPDYPAAFLSDGNVMITLWQANDPKSAVPFNRKTGIGLHHLALAVDGTGALGELHRRLDATDGVGIEFAPEPLLGGPTQHMMCTIPGGIRVEFIAA